MIKGGDTVEKKKMAALKRIRKERGFTQQQLADELGLHIKSYQRYECGTRRPNIYMLLKIAELLGVKASELLDETDDKSEEK